MPRKQRLYPKTRQPCRGPIYRPASTSVNNSIIERNIYMQQNSGTSMSQVEMQQAAQDCMACHDVCLQTVQQCQQAGGKHAQESHIQMMQDCATLCLATAHFLQHASPVVTVVCSATAQVTARCAFESEQM